MILHKAAVEWFLSQKSETTCIKNTPLLSRDVIDSHGRRHFLPLNVTFASKLKMNLLLVSTCKLWNMSSAVTLNYYCDEIGL